MGRDRFFDDLAGILDVPDDWISVAEADERYREVFAALVAPVDVRLLRRECMILEARGAMGAASRVYAARANLLTPADRDWFRADLEAVTRGEWTVRDGAYAGPPEPPPPPPTRSRRALGAARRTVGGVRRRVGPAWQRVAGALQRPGTDAPDR